MMNQTNLSKKIRRTTKMAMQNSDTVAYLNKLSSLQEKTLPLSDPLQINLTLTPSTGIENEIAALQ
jgi:hypothetical protein